MQVRLMARRLRNPDGEPWTEAGVHELGGRSPDALQWLERVLFPFVWDEVASGVRKEKIGRRGELLVQRAQLRQRILQLDSEIARTA